MKTGGKAGGSLRVYLSGGMEYAHKEGSDWRNDIEDWIRTSLGHEVFNPNKESARYLSGLLNGNDFRSLKSTDLKRFTELVSGIVDLDSKELAERTDYVVCYWDHSAQRGAGTKGELTIARLYGKPVYMVTETHPENIPGWILGCTSEMFSSFEGLKQYLLGQFSTTKEQP